jgi:hypothetical protein
MVPPHLKQSIGGFFSQKYYNFQTMINDVERYKLSHQINDQIN